VTGCTKDAVSAATAQRNERPVVNRKAMGSTPVAAPSIVIASSAPSDRPVLNGKNCLLKQFRLKAKVFNR